jgi:hypothetical protein
LNNIDAFVGFHAYRMRLFESKVLRKTFGRKREEVRRGDYWLPPRGK